MPTAALQGGFDVAVKSIHKTLGSLLATAMINVSKSSKIPAQNIKNVY